MYLQSFFGFGSAVDIDIVLDGQETRKTAEIKGEDGKLETHYLYFDGETISGKVSYLTNLTNAVVCEFCQFSVTSV